MHKSSLLDIIRTFTPKELAKFEDFVISPFFNKNKNVINLFIEVKKYAPEYNDENLEKEKVWEKIFDSKEYNYGIMKNLIFDLSKLAEKFIMNLRFNKDELKQNEYIIQALLDRQLHKIFINKYKSIDKGPDLRYLNENGLSILNYINFMREIYNLKLSYYHEFDMNFKTEKLQYDIDSYILSSIFITLFTYYAIILADSHTKNFDLDNNPFSKLLELILPGIESLMESTNNNSQLNSCYIEIYFLMYRALKESNEKHYLDFKSIVFENIGILPKYDLQTLYYCLLVTIANKNFTKLNPHKEVLEIYDSLIENNLMTTIRNEVIPVYIFNNYIYKCFLISDAAKIENFALQFVNKLDPKCVESSNIYVEFLISFLNKNFQKALTLLALLEIPYFTQKINLKYLKGMCLYETGEFEMFLNEFDSLKHFIRNNNFVNNTSSAKLNKHFSIIKKLFDLKMRFDKYEFLKLKEDVLQTYNGSNPWFNEKLNEIEKLN